MSKLKHANGNMILSEEQKQEMIKDAAEHYGRYMDSLKIDWRNDPNSSDTPMRVAKAFVNDLAEGVYSEGPKITAFDNVCSNNLGVAVMVSANHMCACVRGVKHDATMKTSKLSSEFMNYKSHAREEFYSFIGDLK